MLSIRQHRSSRSLSSSSSNTKVNVPKRTFPLIQVILLSDIYSCAS